MKKEKLKKIVTISTFLNIISTVIISIIYSYLKCSHHLSWLINKPFISSFLFLLDLFIIFILLKWPKSLYYIVTSELIFFFSASLVYITGNINFLVIYLSKSKNYMHFPVFISLWIILLFLIQEILKLRIFTSEKISSRGYRLFNISIIFITSFFILFAAISFIFYSKVIATLVGSLLLFLSHSFFKNILPSIYEIHDLINSKKSLLNEYEPSIISKITLTAIDAFSALIVFSYGIAQLFANQYTVILHLNPKSKDFHSISKLITAKNVYIDHIEVPQRHFMLTSNENLFFIIFIVILYILGFLLWTLLKYLYHDIYNNKDKTIKIFTDKLIKLK